MAVCVVTTVLECLLEVGQEGASPLLAIRGVFWVVGVAQSGLELPGAHRVGVRRRVVTDGLSQRPVLGPLAMCVDM